MAVAREFCCLQSAFFGIHDSYHYWPDDTGSNPHSNVMQCFVSLANTLSIPEKKHSYLNLISFRFMVCLMDVLHFALNKTLQVHDKTLAIVPKQRCQVSLQNREGGGSWVFWKFDKASRWWFQKKICSPLPGEIIQFNYFFKWVETTN